MSRRHGSGSVGDHYAALARARGTKPPDPPRLPPEAAHVWDTFMDLHRTRWASQHGPLPITYAEIQSRTVMQRDRLKPWEVQAIRALDDLWLSEAAGPATANDKTT